MVTTFSEETATLVAEILRAIRSHLDMSVAFVSEFAEGRRIFRAIDTDLAACPIEVGGGDPLEDSYCQRVVDGRLPGFIADATTNEEALKLPATLALPVGTHLSVPITLSSGEVFGTFCCFSHELVAGRSEKDLESMQRLADAVAAIIERERGTESSLSELQARYDDVSRLAATIAHDLKTPLSAVLGFAELVEREFAERLGETGGEWLGLVTSSARYAVRMINDLHAFAQAGGAIGDPEPVDLAALVGSVRDSLRVPIEASGASIDIGPLPVVTGHPGPLRQLFQNLFANAMKFVPAGEHPAVVVRAEDGPPGWVVVTVADNGIGIPESDRERVFEPFVRARTGDPYEGTGLGLALVHRVVTVHGGSIAIEGNDPRGTVFRFSLPRA